MTTNSLNDDGLGMGDMQRKEMQDYILRNKIEAARRGGDLGKLQVAKNDDGVWTDMGGPWPWEKQVAAVAH